MKRACTRGIEQCTERRGFGKVFTSSITAPNGSIPYGAFWFSPLDMLGWTLLSSLALTLVVGITPQAATIVLLLTTFFGIFQHANIRTPRWLGYFIQRPESHSRHHARGVHTGNFSDLPFFDLLFGTFHNPREFSAEQGFYHGASARIPEMLRFRDVSEPSRT